MTLNSNLFKNKSNQSNPKLGKLFNYPTLILKQEKEILKNSSFIFLSGILSAVISTVSNIIFSRFFGPFGFGIFRTSIGLASITAYTLDLGVKYLLPRYIAEFEGKNEPENTAHLIERVFLFKSAVAFLVLIFFFILRHQIVIIFLQQESQTFLVWPIMLLFALMFLDLTGPILFGFQNFRLFALTSIIVPSAYIAFGLPLAYKFGIQGALFGVFIANVVGIIPAIRFILKRIVRNKKTTSFSFRKAIIHYSIPAYFANVPSYVSVAIIPILSLFFTQRQVGFYSLSLSFYTTAQLIPTTLSNVMFPKVAQLHSQQKTGQALKTFKSLMVIYTPFVVIGGTLIVFTAKPLIQFLIPSFLPAIKMIEIQTVAGLFFGYFAIALNYVTAIGKLKIATILNWILSIIFLILAFYITSLVK